MTEFDSYSYDGVSAVIGVQHTEVSWAMGNFFRNFFVYNGYISDISLVYFGHILGISWAYLWHSWVYHEDWFSIYKLSPSASNVNH